MAREHDGIDLHLVCTGRMNEYWPTIEAEVRELNLERQVHVLGYIPEEHVRALYRLCAFTVFPSLFEGSGLPALEALAEGAPLACSNIPVLTDQVGGAAELFDPTSVESIAASLVKVTKDAEYRAELVTRATIQGQGKNWANVAQAIRALYRSLARVRLDPDDCRLLHTALDTGRVQGAESRGTDSASQFLHGL
jgi:glycosyltransferase involved in cell wall biosynthesis